MKNLPLQIAAGIVLGLGFIFVVVETGSLVVQYFSDQGGSAREAADEVKRRNDEVERLRAERVKEYKRMCAQGDVSACNVK